MKKYLAFASLISLFSLQLLISQAQVPVKKYSHSFVVDSVLQTKNYTYIRGLEKIAGKDSSLWMALPVFEPKQGETYYYESGLQMGEFRSKELNRTFSEILFLGGLSTSLEMSDKTIVATLKPAAKDTTVADTTALVLHTVLVKEVLQTNGYTYLRVIENGKEDWLAVVKIPAKVGQTYTYDDAAPMMDFTSKELKRTFPKIYFLSKLTEVKDKASTEPANDPVKVKKKTSDDKKSESKKEIHIDPVHGGLTIETLLQNATIWEGKVVQVRGEVTKFSKDIMSRNWIHIQDGTNFSGKKELVITSDATVKEGDVITFEGLVKLKQDFGSGYYFEVLLEDALVK